MEMEREKEQEFEWLKAQKIEITVDLLAAAKQQLQFLAAVDKNRWLYDGPTLDRAIFRYNACWLPLLAKHLESPISEGPLVVPLDCEWIWHCHRLNPLRYKSDCEELYGKILDYSDVVSSVNGVCKRQTEEIWNRFYPHERYDLDLDFSEAVNEKISTLEKCTNYDLVSAVKRQSPFFYQVSRPHMNNDIFLQGAIARYKGFLHIIKRNWEKSINCFCVPTYDIDLIWHTHQLHPVSYCKDASQALGRILAHDDMDSDRSKGKKLDVGFFGTTRHWEETFGRRYWKAGAMYRGSDPSPLTTIPFQSNILSKEFEKSNQNKMIELSELKIVEVLLEIVGVKNLPERHKGNLFVMFNKKQPDLFFNVKRKLTILSESGDKHVASFQCEPKGELFFELVSHSPSNLPLTKVCKTMGATSFSLEDFLNPVSELSVERWVELQPTSGNMSSKPICLRIAVSFSVPIQAPYELHMIHPRAQSKSSCFFPLPGRAQHPKIWTSVVEKTDAEIISLQMRNSTKAKEKERSILKQQVTGVMKTGETCILAEFVGNRWCLMDSQWYLEPKKKSNEDGHLFELIGCRTVKLFQGKKLDFEPEHCEKKRSEQDFMTAVEFSAEYPYGKAVALLDLKSGFVKVKESWLVLPVLISAFILTDILKKEGYNGFTSNRENLEVDSLVEKAKGLHEEPEQISLTAASEGNMELNVDVAKGSIVRSGNCGGGCGGCGSGCGDMVRSGNCGGGCGGCGSGCGDMVRSGNCGGGCGGCGSGCGDMVKSGNSGDSGCGDTMKSGNSGGCGGCGGGCGGCGGGCGNMVRNGN
ncbi:glycine-rich domain-containing protein 1-like isoform X1 [Populus alba x Populus x berolinensis]|nr:glycine-rich domain-containing protein 1-like isoform X1 [Populus alba x Populus x berolinensis]